MVTRLPVGGGPDKRCRNPECSRREQPKEKVRVENGHRVYFGLTLSQVEQAIQLLERLEAKREAKSLPEIGVVRTV